MDRKWIQQFCVGEEQGLGEGAWGMRRFRLPKFNGSQTEFH